MPVLWVLLFSKLCQYNSPMPILHLAEMVVDASDGLYHYLSDPNTILHVHVCWAG